MFSGTIQIHCFQHQCAMMLDHLVISIYVYAGRLLWGLLLLCNLKGGRKDSKHVHQKKSRGWNWGNRRSSWNQDKLSISAIKSRYSLVDTFWIRWNVKPVDHLILLEFCLTTHFVIDVPLLISSLSPIKLTQSTPPLADIHCSDRNRLSPRCQDILFNTALMSRHKVRTSSVGWDFTSAESACATTWSGTMTPSTTSCKRSSSSRARPTSLELSGTSLCLDAVSSFSGMASASCMAGGRAPELAMVGTHLCRDVRKWRWSHKNKSSHTKPAKPYQLTHWNQRLPAQDKKN